MTYRELIHNCTDRLSRIYEPREARSIMLTVIETVKGWTQTDLVMHDDAEVSDFIAGKVDGITDRLLRHEPVQYVLGEAYWHGMTLKVTPAVLIPRPETSQLVDIIADSCKGSDLRVVDLCTGSGAIAIALSRYLDFPDVTGVDVSDSALGIARENAESLHATVKFDHLDILGPWPWKESSWDVIVSNPPYVLEREKSAMDANVLDYEPALALFVPDTDPLKFYRPIAREGFRTAAPGCRLFLELNPDFASQTMDLFRTEGWADVEVLADLYGRKRFLKAVRPQ